MGEWGKPRSLKNIIWRFEVLFWVLVIVIVSFGFL